MFEFLKSSGKVCVTAVAANLTSDLTGVTSDPTLQLAEYSLVEDDLTDEDCVQEIFYKYKSMQYSLFTNFGVELIGGALFFITAIYIVRDKLACENASAGNI